MIKLSRMADYGILLASRMAADSKRVYRAQELSDYSTLPITTVNKILSKLTRSNITESHRGANGGYKLALSAEKITVRNIIDVIDGKIALVTGGSRGIGRAIALRLAKEGTKVAINYKANQEAAHWVVDAVAEMGGEVPVS